MPHLLHDAVGNIDARHAAREGGRGVPIGDVGNELEAQLAGVHEAVEGLVVLGVLHALLHHHACLQNLLQHLRQNPLALRGLDKPAKVCACARV